MSIEEQLTQQGSEHRAAAPARPLREPVSAVALPHRWACALPSRGGSCDCGAQPWSPG